MLPMSAHTPPGIVRVTPLTGGDTYSGLRGGARVYIMAREALRRWITGIWVLESGVRVGFVGVEALRRVFGGESPSRCLSRLVESR